VVGMDLTIANSNLDHLVSGFAAGRGFHLSTSLFNLSRFCQ
jgi:hypothetical protein